MDAGAVLNSLLARHSSFLASTNAKGTRQKARRGEDVSGLCVPPPEKVAEAVGRGVNPLLLRLDTNKAEKAAREKAKQRRGQAGPRGTAASSKKERATSAAATTHSGTAVATPQNRPAEKSARARETPLLPVARKVELAREQAVSKTANARLRELRAQRQEEEEAMAAARKRSRSAAEAPPAARDASGTRKHARAESAAAALPGSVGSPSPPPSQLRPPATAPAAKSRREVWRRRCSTKKIVRLSRGVSRAAAVRRYWYTTLRAKHTDGTAPSEAARSCSDKEKSAVAAASPAESVTDAAELRCAARRRRVARRAILAAHHARIKAHPRPTATAAAAPSGEANTAAAPAAPRLTRHQYKAALRSALAHAERSMWAVAARAVAERRGIMAELTRACGATDPRRDGVLPLLLARHFPLFGAAVEVQELVLRVPPLKRHGTRHRRRERSSSSSDGGAAPDSAAQLSVVQRHGGIVVEEYSASLGVLLLPPTEAGRRAWATALEQQPNRLAPPAIAPPSDTEAVAEGQRCAAPPRVVRVPKHFPGASGSFTELLPQLLATARRCERTSDSDSPAAQRTPAHSRVLIAVFVGEAEAAAGGQPAASSSAAAYPLKRLLNRCL